ncbi:NACHT, LRR and PYD domains-containing protein 3-like isoform X2 [Triplophysa rosa]|uniref:NACHT, LRR and PYD domains-containing protein 3-like isoform X2 n=1 Tax=Triplophysa rosa TaxID=992332 RepID=UPI002545D365|nr:NACHT, LRR and PYD domains-containing protein 3-like isoform X2 [Triplophysa rosa]
MEERPERLCDSLSHTASVVASNGAVANVPQMVGCQVTGSVNINITTHVNASVNSEQSQHADSSRVQLSERLKISLKKKFERIHEGLAKRGNQTLLNRIYTQLYITEGERDTVNTEHEVWQIDNVMKKQHDRENPINCNDIFKPLSDQTGHIKTVLTKGIAGIGKTVSVHKFILDWAEGTANQDVDFMFLLPFRELNLIGEHRYSLHKLLLDFHPELQDVENEKIYDKSQVVFIFDGLDESQLNLDFDRTRVCDVIKTAKVNDLIVNLIKGNLLPSAQLWITSRPASEDKIPAEYITRVTEIQGFDDAQKEEYFRKRISDEHQASRIISHIRRARSLHIMCHIPVFCWITATVLQKVLETEREQISSSLTEMYTRFLLIQINENKRKYLTGIKRDDVRNLHNSDVETVLNLGRLAFENLLKSNLVFSKEELRTFGFDVNEPSVWSGVCTQILTEEDPMFSESKYSFVHLSFQEYLAALFVFHSYVVKKVNLLKKKAPRRMSFYDDYYDEYDLPGHEDQQTASVKEESLHDFQRCAVDVALKSTSGHLDLFLRFLLGISYDHCQPMLKSFQIKVDRVQLDNQKTTEYIRTKLKEEDDRKTPSAERCINLLFCLMELGDHSMIEEIQRFHMSEVQRGQKLTAAQCSTLAYIIQMSDDVLEELDLSKYKTTDEGRQRLVPAVRNCRKAILSACTLTQKCCEIITSALLKPQNSVLEELDISWQCLRDLSPLYRGLDSPYCRLRSLDFSHTNLEKRGTDLLHAALFGPQIQLQTLRVFSCGLTDDCTNTLALALESSESRLTELNVGYNNFTSAGAERILRALLSPSCELMKLCLSGCQVSVESCKLLSSALEDSFLMDLDLSSSCIGDAGLKQLCAGLSSPRCQMQILRLRDCALSGSPCLYLAVALSCFSVLRELDLSNNDLRDSGVKLISAGLQNSILRCLGLSGCMVTDEGCCCLASALSSNPSHLTELDLSYNHPGHLGVQQLSDRRDDTHCALEILRLDYGGPLRIIRGLWKYYQELTLDPMTTDSALTMSSDNKGVARLPEGHFLSDDSESEKVNSWRIALCREMLSGGRFYWQVDWKGFVVTIGVKFKTKIKSFAQKVLHLCCSSVQYVAMHEDKSKTRSIAAGVMPKSRTVGVFLDCAGGTLSFYSILPHGPVHLHTFHTAFSDPVSPCFRFSPTDLEIQPSWVIIHTLVPSSVVHTHMLLMPKVIEAFECLSFDPISCGSAWR